VLCRFLSKRYPKGYLMPFAHRHIVKFYSRNYRPPETPFPFPAQVAVDFGEVAALHNFAVLPGEGSYG
jgi:hypothetical protein